MIPEDINCERFGILCESLKEVAAYASSKNMHFAIETGPEHAVTLKKFLDAVDDFDGVEADIRMAAWPAAVL